MTDAEFEAIEARMNDWKGCYNFKNRDVRAMLDEVKRLRAESEQLQAACRLVLSETGTLHRMEENGMVIALGCARGAYTGLKHRAGAVESEVGKLQDEVKRLRGASRAVLDSVTQYSVNEAGDRGYALVPADVFQSFRETMEAEA